MSSPKDGSAPGACFLCEAVASTDDVASLVAYRNDWGIVVMNRYPYNSGHVMVVPLRHVGDLELLTAEERAGLLELLVATLSSLKVEMTPDGCNVGLNLGKAAGAGVPDHLHIHAVPRWEGDTNFMPVLSDTMVLPENIATARERLHKRLSGDAQ